MKKYLIQWENIELKTSGECIMLGNSLEDAENEFYKMFKGYGILSIVGYYDLSVYGYINYVCSFNINIRIYEFASADRIKRNKV